MSDDHLEDEGHGGHSSAPFTDLMASLMVIFILLFVATVNNASTSRTTIRNTLVDSLRVKLRAKDVDASSIHTDPRDPYAVVIVMPSSLLFASDSFVIPVNGQGHDYLWNVIPSLAELLCSAEFTGNIDNVVVEGHTDTAYKGRGGALKPDQGPAHNLELSQKRSMAVVKTALQALLNRPQRACFRRMLSASGRGQEEPLPAAPDSAQRRVVFKIRVKADLVSAFTAGIPTGAEVPPAPSAGVPPP